MRFCLNDRPKDADRSDSPRKDNNFSAFPAMRGLGRYYELTVECRGEANRTTGYFLNIKEIDDAFRSDVLPWLEDIVAAGPTCCEPMGALLRGIVDRLSPKLHGTVAAAELALTPRYNLTIRTRDMDNIIIRQQFEFSAAHRLHVPEMSDEDNRKTFGKCNNPAGHGHNYQLEVAVRAPIDTHGRVVAVESIDRLVDETVIEKLDHKHLNVDVPAFESLNPSVENIAKVIYEMLDEKIADIGVELEAVRVWETGKTVCEYRGVERVG